MTRKETIESIFLLHDKCIKNTEPKCIVVEKNILLCNLTNAVMRVLSKLSETENKPQLSSSAVYISTKSLKHIYDRKPAVLYDFVLENVYDIVKFPNHIYKNSSGKRGEFCFVKVFEDKKYLCSLEVCVSEIGETQIFVATVFNTDDSYLNKFNLLWSWRDDISSS